MITKKIRRIIMSFIMIFIMFIGLNVNAQDYDLFANGVQFSDDNLVVPCGDGTATFDPSTKTLTLENATIDQSYDDWALITDNIVDGVLNVVVIGNNVLIGNSGYYDAFDTDNEGINITGTGTLTFNETLAGVYAANTSSSLAINGVTINMTIGDMGQAFAQVKDITFTNCNVNITSEAIDGKVIDTSGGTITVTNSNITINSESGCINIGGEESGRKFILNSGVVNLTCSSGYPLSATLPETVSIVVNGGTLRLNGPDGGTTISNIQIANGHAMTKGDDISSHEIEISPAVTISGNIAWVDNDNEGSTRPSNVTIYVKNPGGQTEAYQETSASQNWAYSMQVAMYDVNGNTVSYSLVVDGADGYNTMAAGYNITMILDGMSTDEVFPSLTTYTQVIANGTIEDLDGVTVDTESYESELLTGDTIDTPVATVINQYKEDFNTWASENDATGSTTSEGITSIYFQSDQVGTTHYSSMDDLVQAFKNDGGSGVLNVNKVQTYTMVYEATKNPEREKTTIAGAIDWEDSANQDGKRPASVSVSIKNGSTIVDTQTVTADNNWAYSFEGLFIQDLDGNNITYTLDGSAVSGYTITLDGNNLVYTHTPEKTTIAGTITWNDNNNALGLRPENITITLLKNGIVQDTQTKSDGTYIFANLDKYSGGSLAEYTIQVSSNENYITSLSGYDITMNCKKQVITGTITWNDDNDINEARPLQVEVPIRANGETVETKALSLVTNWSFSSTVDKYDSSNNEITYTAVYPNIDNYDKSVSGFNATYTYSVTTVDVSGKITWSDGDNRDGLRPNKVVVTLYNGSEAIKSVNATADTNWNYSFTGLNKNDNQGNPITYTTSVNSTLEGYEFAQSGYNFTYTHEPEKINISGTITWNDSNDQDGLRPNSLTVQLKNGNSVVKEATLTSADWSYSFTNVYKNENGSPISYTVAPQNAVSGYTYEQSGYNLIFAHTHEVVTINGNVTWNDSNDQDGFRPQTLEVGVYIGNERVRYMEVSAANNWTYSFPDLDKLDQNGDVITYTIKSNENLTGYTYQTAGYNIVYTHHSETVSVSGKITWNDNSDELGLRPSSVKVTLLANGSESQNVNVTESDNWNFNIENLPKYRNGAEVEYTVSTQSFDNYNISNSGNNFTYECNKIIVSGQISFEDSSNQDGKRPTSITINIKNGNESVKEVNVKDTDNWTFEELVNKYDSNDNAITYTIAYPDVEDYTKATSGNNAIYSHTPEKTTVSGTIVFNDNNNQDQIRPTKVNVTLKKGSTSIETKEVTITGDSTSFEFTNVDKYSNGEVINYTFAGADVADYEVAVSGTQITYSHAIATTRVEGSIIWNDSNNQDGYRPSEVEVTLSNGEKKTVTAVDNWEFSFTGLDKYDNGELINYTVSSDENLNKYHYSVDGYEITYTHTPEKVTINGKVIFNDGNNQDGIRPTKVTLSIDNGTTTITREVTIEGNTTNYSISDLPKFAGGELITYTVNGQAVNKYQVSKDNNDITYTHTPDTTSVSGKVTWNDANDQDGKRPSEVDIVLSNGSHAVVTAATNWEYEFTDLPKNNDGEEITYTITAPDVEYYTKEVTGNNIKYTHTKETTTLQGTITFDDENDKYGFRPNEITVTIKNGSTTVKTIKANSSNNWTYTATLDKYSSGTEINYTISTNQVNNYQLIDNSPNFEYKCTKIKITTTATFVDNNDEAGLRPSKVEIELYGNTSLVQTIELTSSNNFRKTITLDKYATDNTEIAYTITPKTIDSYEVSKTDYDATYTYNGTAKKKVTGQITWNDASTSTRPSSVTIVLYQNGVEYTRASTTENDSWKYSFVGLPKENDEGLEYEYTIDVESVNGYTSSIDGNNVTLDKINYRIIEGNGDIFVVNEDTDATFRVNGDYDLFDKLYIDNKIVSRENYEVTEGSTIITLKDSFVKSLSSGKHTIKVTYTDGGYASGTFSVQRTSTNDSISEITNPTTGDKIVLYIILLISSTLGIFVIRTNLKEAN